MAKADFIFQIIFARCVWILSRHVVVFHCTQKYRQWTGDCDRLMRASNRRAVVMVVAWH